MGNPDASVLVMLTDAAQSHTDDVLWETRLRNSVAARAPLKAAFVKIAKNELPSYTPHVHAAVAAMVSRRGDRA